MKWVCSGVYLSQCEIKQKINEKAQTANFSVLARGRRPRKELFAKKKWKTRETKTQITQTFESMATPKSAHPGP